MNKTNKYKTQETLCYSFLSAWVIGIILIMITSSCSTSNQVVHTKPVGKNNKVCSAYI